jgi:hypothetical protein
MGVRFAQIRERALYEDIPSIRHNHELASILPRRYRKKGLHSIDADLLRSWLSDSHASKGFTAESWNFHISRLINNGYTVESTWISDMMT